MHREGHIGAALLFYAPIGFVTAVIATIELAVLGVLVAAALAMVPDLDMRVPGIEHRGVTHTVHFAVATGIGVGLLGVVIGWSSGPVAAIALGVFGFAVGTATVVSHIAADALTPAGVDPFRRGDRISYDVARARNPIANYALLAIGVVACAVAAWLVNLLGVG